jgi:hypothetical protein
MAATGGTGSAGANQDGTTPAGNEISKGAHTPGEVIFTGQDASHSVAAGPKIDTAFVDQYVWPAFDTAVKAPLRDKLIWDQFVTWKPSVQRGSIVNTFLGDDIDPTGADIPLVENLDVDSVTFDSWAMSFSGDEYGRAVSRTRLANARTAINIDPQIVDRVAWDAARAADRLCQKGMMNTTTGVLRAGAYKQRWNSTDVITAQPSAIPAATAATDFLTTTVLQVCAAVLDTRNVMPFRGGSYVLLCNPVGAQHLKNERDTGGFRYVTARNEGSAGNSIFRGQIGMTEGVDIIVSNRVPAGKAYVLGKDAIAKTFLNSEGYSESPSTVVAPVIDKLRRFLSWGWLHYVGYNLYDPRSIIEISHSTHFRPAGAAGLGTLDADKMTDLKVTGAGANKAALETAFIAYLAGHGDAAAKKIS